jgi:YihY family inner membrane protein
MNKPNTGPFFPAGHILRHPGQFTLRVFRGFLANQGLLLAGAVAYYTLLSVVPLFTFLLLILSHLMDERLVVDVLTAYLARVVPGETASIVEQAKHFLAHREVATWVLVPVLLFFGSMAFAILEKAMSVIFFHRVAVRRRHFLVSALLPYFYVTLLAIGLLATTFIASVLQSVGDGPLVILGHTWSLDRLSKALIYLTGLGGEILMLTALYVTMPVGRLRFSHALTGGVTAGLLWEVTRRLLVWYFTTLSIVGVVYGSLATTIIALLTLEVAALILLLGAQVIAEFERVLRHEDTSRPPQTLRT